jgi:signal recognition particle GTPase
MAVPARKPNKALQKFFTVSTPSQARRLARGAGTSVPHLRHVANGHRTMSAEFAQKLAKASEAFKDEKLLLLQQDLCRACKVCPLVNGQ